MRVKVVSLALDLGATLSTFSMQTIRGRFRHDSSAFLKFKEYLLLIPF